MTTQGIQHLGNEFQTCEKDIQLVEKETQQTGNAIISLKNRENIRKGVEKQLNKWWWRPKYEVSSYTNSKEADKDENNRLGVMQLISSDVHVLPNFHSENNGNMILAYKKNPTFVYTLDLCEQKGTNTTKFIYSWNDGDEYYAAAPYFARNSSVVMCTCQLNITEAVNSKKPIKKISKRLNKLKLTNRSKKPFRKDKYSWRKVGNDNNFSVYIIEGQGFLYWERENDKDNEGNIILVGESQKSHLQFLQY